MNKRILALLLGAAAATSTAFAQSGGPLTPPGIPGNPATVMPSLTEIYNVAKEPRAVIPAQTATYTITQSGNYVLSGDIVVSTGNGITIDASDVTIDLNGFTIRSTAAPTNGIGVRIETSARNVVVKNGSIKCGGSIGFTGGVDFYSNDTVPRVILLEDLRLGTGGVLIRVGQIGMLAPRITARRITSSSGGILLYREQTLAPIGTVVDCQMGAINAHHVVNSSSGTTINAVVSVGNAENVP
jgi:hypothetical protein